MNSLDSETTTSALDEDVLELLAESQQPAAPSVEVVARMRGSIMQRVAAEKNQTGSSFKTLLANDGWSVEAPGLELKILNEEALGVFSCLIRLAAGFKMEGHDHPVDEECLMLEGDLSLGSITLNAGDYHLAPKGMPHGAVSSKNGCMAFLRGAIPAVPQSLSQP